MKRLILASIVAILGVVATAQAQSADLGTAREIRFGSSAPEIDVLAAELGSAVQIYEYVRNECEFLPYYGVRSGSVNALSRKGGNDIDLAALLIALLRSRGIHARYATGTITVADADLATWVGVPTVNEAMEVLNASGATGPLSSTNGRVSFPHVWAEALLPIGNYRGGAADASATPCATESNSCRWVALDPSFKKHQLTPASADSLSDALNFNYARYYDAITGVPDATWMNVNPVDLLQREILRVRPTKSVSDITGAIAIVGDESGLLPGSLPYEVDRATLNRFASAAEHDGLTYNDAIHCPANPSTAWTRCVGFTFVGISPTSAPAERTLATYSAPLDRLSLQSVGMVSASVARAVFPMDCSPSATACDKILFDYPSSNSLITLAVEPRDQEYYELRVDADVYGPNIGAPASLPQVKTALDRDSSYVFFAGGVEANASQVNDAARVFTDSYQDGQVRHDGAGYYIDVNGNGTREQPPDLTVPLTGDPTRNLLFLAGRQYAFRLQQAVAQIAALTQTRANRYYAAGFTSAQTNGVYVDGAPFSIAPSGLLVDAVAVGATPYRFVAGVKTPYRDLGKMLDYAGSSLEHELWQELTGFDAISTVRAFQKVRKRAGSLAIVKSTSDLPVLYQTAKFAAAPTDFTPLVVPLHDIYSTIAENPMVWVPASQATLAQHPYFTLLKSAVDAGTDPSRLSAGIYLGTPLQFTISQAQSQAFRDHLPAGVNRFPLWSWQDLVQCFRDRLTEVQSLSAGASAGTTQQPRNLCLAPEFSGTVGQLRTSIADQWAFFKSVYQQQLELDFDFGHYVDTRAGFAAADFRYRDADATGGQIAAEIVQLARDTASLPSPPFTALEFVVPSSRIIEADRGYDVFYGTWQSAGGRFSWTYIAQGGVGAGGGYVTGDDVVVDWTTDPALQDETVTYDNAYHTNRVLNPDSNNSPHSPYVGDPVSTATGNLFHDETDFVIAAQPFDIAFTRTYNSRLSRLLERFDNTDVRRTYWPLGPGWTHSYAMMLITNDFGAQPNAGTNDGVVSSVTFIDGRGGETNFPIVNGAAVSPPGFFGTLKNWATNTPSIEFADGTRYTFSSRIPTNVPDGVALLQTMEDAYGRMLTIDFGANSGDRTQTVTDYYGRQITLQHSAGRLSSVRDWTGRTWTFGYDTVAGLRQRLTSVTTPQQRTTTYDYAVPMALGLPMSFAEGVLYRMTGVHYPPRANAGGLQRSMLFDYFTNGRAASTVDALGNTELVDYNLFDRSATVTDPRGFLHTYVNDDRGSLQTLVRPDGNVQQFATNGDNLRFQKSDAYGRLTTYSYAADEGVGTPADRGGNVTLEQDPTNHSAHYAYGAVTTPQGRSIFVPTGTTDKSGNQRILQYCTSDTGGCVRGKLWRVNLPPLTTLEERSYFSDGTLQRISERIDPADSSRKRITDFVYDTSTHLRPDGKTISGASSGGALQWRYGYDSSNLKRLTSESLELGTGSITHPVGVVRVQTSYGYDDLDRVTSVTRPDGSTTYTDYDEDGNLSQVRAVYANGEQRTLSMRTYDAAGRLLSDADTVGKLTQWTYDEMGNVLTVTDRNGHTTRYEYDAMGRRTRVIDPNGNVVVMDYNANGDVSRIVTAAGTTQFQRDAVGRVTRTISPLLNTTVQGYDGSGKVTSYRDASVVGGARTGNAQGNSVTTDYDAFGRVWHVTDATGGVTTFEYDFLGNRTAVIDARGKRTSFAYNDLGQLVTVTDPLLRTITMTYDTAGLLATRTDRNGRKASYSYDGANRLTGIDFDSTGPGLDEERHYDAFGNLDWIRNANVTYTYGYDSLNRRKRKTDSRTGKSIQWDYDFVGNVTSRTGYEGDVTTFTYDSADRLVAMSNPAYLGATYHYDEAGRLLDRIFSNGTRTVFGYDADSRLTEVQQYDAASTLVGRERYCLDAVGNITRIIRGASGSCAAPGTDWTQYTYDDLYRLTGEDEGLAGGGSTVKTSLSYDAVGNIRTAFGDGDAPLPGRTYTIDNANRLTDVRRSGVVQFQYDYDNEGNRTAKKDANGVVLERYQYDDKNRLTSVTQGTQTTTYLYDPFDYRIGVKVGNEVTQYFLDGEHTEAIYNGGGKPIATFLRGAVIDEIVGAYYYDARGRGTFYTYTHDRLTSVARLADHTGAAVQTYGYGPFGADRSGTGTSPNRLKYTGREQDASGFYYYRARYYDPGTRRFLNEDPLGFRAGVNFYSYAENNPIGTIDPTGTLGIGWGVSGSLEGGVGVIGAGGTYSGGVGLFSGAPVPFAGREGASFGAFTSSGVFIGGPGYGTSVPEEQPGGTKFAVGAFGGVGTGPFVTNANNPEDLAGPFNTYSFNLGIGPIKFGIQVGESNGTVIVAVTYGPGEYISASSYPTNTTVTAWQPRWWSPTFDPGAALDAAGLAAVGGSPIAQQDALGVYDK